MIPMLSRQPGFVSCQFFLLLVFLFVGVGVETHVENSNVVKATRSFLKICLVLVSLFLGVS